MDGIGWFTVETVKRMVTAHPEHKFFLLCDRKVDLGWPLPANCRQVVLHPPARHPVLWYLFFEWGVAPALKRLKADLFLSTDGWMSLRTNVPTLTVIHDINYEHADDYLRPSHQRYMKHFFPRFVRKATRVATVSQFSRQDIAQVYHLSPAKIDVVYDGAHVSYQPLGGEEKELVRQRYTQGKPYFIFIGTVTKRKNLANMLLAFDQFKEQDRQGTKFLVVGAKVWWQDELKAAYDGMRHQADVTFLGRVEAEELAKLLSSAVALTYVSYFEGFGIPILAFQAETAVLAGNTTSMPEVAGDAALLVSPDDVAGISEAMIRLANDEELRNSLIARGSSRRCLFNWDRTAILLWESSMKTYQEACGAKS